MQKFIFTILLLMFFLPNKAETDHPEAITAGNIPALQPPDTIPPLYPQHISPKEHTTLRIGGETPTWLVSEYLYYYVDETATTTFDYVSDPSNNYIFQPAGKTLFASPPSDNLLWFRFDVINHSDIPFWYLHIDYAPINKVRIYLSDPAGITDTLSTEGMDNDQGSFFTDRSGVIHKLSLKKNVPYTVWMEVKSNAYLHLPVTLNSDKEIFARILKKSRFLYGLLSLIFIAALTNFLLYIRTRARTYLLLAVTIFFFLIIILYQFGVDVIPSMDPYYKNRIRILAFSLMMIFFHWFTIHYLEIHKSKFIYRLFKASIIFYILYFLVVLLPVFSLVYINTLTPVLNLISLLFLSSTGWYFLKKKHRFAGYFLIFNLGMLASGIIWIFLLNNVLPYSLFSGMITLLLTTTLLLLISLAHSDNIIRLQEERTKSNQFQSLLRQLNAKAEERLQMEEKLRKSEEKFRTLFEMMPQPVVLTDLATGTIEDCNASMLELIKSEKQSLIGNTAVKINFIQSEDRASLIQEITQKGEVKGRELAFESPEYGTVHMLVYSKPIVMADIPKLLSVLVDVSTMKKAQDEIRKLSVVIENSANTIIITNHQSEIEYVNAHFTKQTGYSAEEVMGKNPSLLKSGILPPSFYEEIYKIINRGEVWQGEFLNRKKDGTLYWENATITPIINDQGQITHYISIKQDITEQKIQMEALKASEIKLRELNASKDKFFSIIGHDLMDPFNALYGFSDMIMESIRNENKEESLEYAGVIRQSATNILHLLQNLLTWARTQSRQQKFNPVKSDINDTIADALVYMLPIAQSKGITITLSTTSEIIAGYDSNMIGTVIRNLLSNAIKFTPGGGKIDVSVGLAEEGVKITVADNGRGIDDKYMDQLFRLDKTFTSRGTDLESGTGLGLVICKDFIDLHNGSIWIESNPGIGTTVNFIIPVNQNINI